jgi:hypothetical protein
MSGETKSPTDLFEMLNDQKNTDVRWMVMELADDSKSIITAGQGSDFPSFKASFDDAKVMWGAFCVHGIDERNSVESVRNKIVQINWVGESVKPMKRMKALQGAKLVVDIMPSIAVTVECTTQEELDAKEIAIKLADCGGAHKPTFYEFGGEMKLSLKDIGKDVAGDGF